MKRVLTVGLTYTGEPIEGVEIETLGLCSSEVDHERAAYPLYEYDTVIINPQTYSHFIFGAAGEFSDSDSELYDLKRQNNSYDLDNAFNSEDRRQELKAAIEKGTTVVWCLAPRKHVNFFGWRETLVGYCAPKLAKFVTQSGLMAKKSRLIAAFDLDSPFARYFSVLARTEWKLCLTDPGEGLRSVASTPEGYSLGGEVAVGDAKGWLITPPTSDEAAQQLVRDSIGIGKSDTRMEKYHGVFLSHTNADKPFVRKLRQDLMDRGVEHVWLDEAEIQIGDSLLTKIDQGLRDTRFVAVVLSQKSVGAPWVQQELEIAMNREIGTGEVVVLPLLYEKCDLPGFLKGKLYADFTTGDEYEASLGKLLRRLRIA
ncbi:toll/interleukin-1 receptor domain-containing protein [Caulobacter sp. NIBR1757]|uniref:toll/interleukin-1 receptor domain-containing protein n=1 Tax=Caulobacter sp. NIBR1757 TaxID=3016000 RepID=UPI0022EFDC85|nr:toll/interleukin-1 receptor domain-containing protein [Caulobacter sp. NIBR1757]WGM40820.1 hypothetical protein AMEJIAPC_03767 [Caulobacter sp. NIBR1757]